MDVGADLAKARPGWDARRDPAIRFRMRSLVTASAWFVLGCLTAGCVDPGEVQGPLGPFELRTALYTVQPSEVIVLLTNAEIGCGMPALDSEVVEEAAAAYFLGLCREGAQHVALTLYDLPGLTLGGTYTGITTTPEDVVSDAFPRTAKAVYYGVEEAFLAEYQNLERQYYAEESVYLDLGDGGSIEVEARGDTLVGSFGIPDTLGGLLTGNFRATQCAGSDDSTLEIIGEDPDHLCRLSIETQ
jgi:hypothetical protein